MSYCVLASSHLVLECKSRHCKMTSSSRCDDWSSFLPCGWLWSANSSNHFSPGEHGISFLSKFCMVECLVKKKTKEPSKRVILSMLLADGGTRKKKLQCRKVPENWRGRQWPIKCQFHSVQIIWQNCWQSATYLTHLHTLWNCWLLPPYGENYSLKLSHAVRVGNKKRQHQGDLAEKLPGHVYSMIWCKREAGKVQVFFHFFQFIQNSLPDMVFSIWNPSHHGLNLLM